MAHKKGEGSTQNGRDSISKRLGVKLFGGQTAKAGNIIVRQRGTRFHPGENTYLGKDFTLHASIPGKVMYKKGKGDKTFIHIIPLEAVEVIAAPAKEAKPVAKVAKAAAKPAAAPAPAVNTAAMEAPVMKAEAPSMDDLASAFDEPAPAKAVKASKGADDLKKIEGIGPKIAELLNEGGINTFAELAATAVERIQEILDAAGPRYRVHNPTTWPQQSALAAEGKWDELKAWQDELNGGK